MCLLVVIGVRGDGEKKLLAVEDGYRESTDSWAAVLRDLKDRGLNVSKLVTGDGALGAWAALRDVFPTAREQRCWVHKSANVLDGMPKRLQPRAKSLLHEMAEAPTEGDARAARERFRCEFDAKYPKATAKLDRDWDALTAFYAFPVDHYVAWRLKRLLVKRKGRNLRAGDAAGWTPAWLRAHGLHKLMGTIRYPGAA